jgi:hypothetical protein
LDVHIRYDSTGQPPRTLHKHVEIQSNDPNNPRLQLELIAHVQLAVTIEPKPLVLAHVARGVGGTAAAVIRPAPGLVMKLTGVDNQDAVFTAALEENEDENGGRWWRVVVSVAKDAPFGSHSTTLAIRCDHARLDPLKLPVSATVASAVRFDTQNPFNAQILNFKRVKAGQPHTRQIDVTNTDPSVPYRITSIDVLGADPRFVSTAVETIEEGVRYTIKVTLSADLDARAIKGTLRVHSDHQDASQTDVVFSAAFIKA